MTPWKYIGTLFFGVPDWCELCNRGNEIYHIVECGLTAEGRGEIQICTSCLSKYGIKEATK